MPGKSNGRGQMKNSLSNPDRLCTLVVATTSLDEEKL